MLALGAILGFMAGVIIVCIAYDLREERKKKKEEEDRDEEWWERPDCDWY